MFPMFPTAPAPLQLCSKVHVRVLFPERRTVVRRGAIVGIPYGPLNDGFDEEGAALSRLPASGRCLRFLRVLSAKRASSSARRPKPRAKPAG